MTAGDGEPRGLRIVRLANFVMARSGGLRTALRDLGRGYLTAGHEPVLIVPGERASDEMTDHGRVITLPGLPLPGTGGYRVLPGRRRLAALLDGLSPDRLEVSDRSTLRWTGRWARSRGVRSMMVSHESLAGLLDVWGVPDRAGARFADYVNARTAADYDVIACTTAWAAREFRRLGADNLVRVTLGVDLETFAPHRYDPAVRARYAAPDEVLVVHCSRLSPEKRPEIAVDTIVALRAGGVPAVGVIVGDGPRRAALRRRAAGTPVHFAGFLPDRYAVAALLASADVSLAPGPVETFGLAALEALACGTPVVVNAASALPEVLGDAGSGGAGSGGAGSGGAGCGGAGCGGAGCGGAGSGGAGCGGAGSGGAGSGGVGSGGVGTDAAGVAAAGTGEDFAAGVRRLLSHGEDERRAAARARAERYGWPAAVDGFLAAHAAPAPVTRDGARGAPARTTAGAYT